MCDILTFQNAGIKIVNGQNFPLNLWINFAGIMSILFRNLRLFYNKIKYCWICSFSFQ